MVLEYFSLIQVRGGLWKSAKLVRVCKIGRHIARNAQLDLSFLLLGLDFIFEKLATISEVEIIFIEKSHDPPIFDQISHKPDFPLRCET